MSPNTTTEFSQNGVVQKRGPDFTTTTDRCFDVTDITLKPSDTLVPYLVTVPS